MNTDIRHKAFVKEVTGSSMTVTIINESACSTCHAKGACSMSEFQEKEIEISHFNRQYSPGEEVTVIFQESQGFKALFYGYILPFLLVMITLIGMFSLSNNEIASGLLALGVLIPYYTTLYYFRHYLKKIFNFEIEERG
ncbi:MAG: SoxR reducing system RseC family protein [Prolixibacteraceae bacterium]